MYGPEAILSWIEEHVAGMRRSRAKTLALIASGAMRMQGTGVLALGRAMDGPTAAKYRIKGVDRFLANEQVELDAVHAALFHQFRPRQGRVVVLADWTDRFAFQTLVLALPCDGRALPFYSITVKKGDESEPQSGSMIAAEREALDTLAQICGEAIRPIIIADRGFGNIRWLGDIQKRGWHYVQRIARNHYVEVSDYIGIVQQLGIRRGWKPRDHGFGTMGDKHCGPIRLVSTYSREANEPWYLVTNLGEESAARIVALYSSRMWIEAMFRDLKNRDWGLGMDKARLTQKGRVERHFLILTLAYIFLVAFGAEAAGLGEQLKANTVEKRVLSLARIGNYFLQTAMLAIPIAIQALLELPT